jgi:hypothetical protein
MIGNWVDPQHGGDCPAGDSFAVGADFPEHRRDAVVSRQDRAVRRRQSRGDKMHVFFDCSDICLRRQVERSYIFDEVLA